MTSSRQEWKVDDLVMRDGVQGIVTKIVTERTIQVKWSNMRRPVLTFVSGIVNLSSLRRQDPQHETQPAPDEPAGAGESRPQPC